MVLTRPYHRISVIFILLAILMGKSFSQARPVNEATVVVAVKEFKVKGINGEIIDPTLKASEVQTSAETSGIRISSTKERNISISTMKMRSRMSKKLMSSAESSPSSTTSIAVHNSGRNRKDDDAKDNFMDFSVDYHSPKQHPPRNN